MTAQAQPFTNVLDLVDQAARQHLANCTADELLAIRDTLQAAMGGHTFYVPITLPRPAQTDAPAATCCTESQSGLAASAEPERLLPCAHQAVCRHWQQMRQPK